MLRFERGGERARTLYWVRGWSNVGGPDPEDSDMISAGITELRIPPAQGELRAAKNDLLRSMLSSLRGNLRW